MGSFSQGWSPRHGHVQYNWMVLDNGDHWIDISRWQWPFSNWHNWMLIDWHIDIILVSYYGIIWYIYIENESNYILDWHSIDISFFFCWANPPFSIFTPGYTWGEIMVQVCMFFRFNHGWESMMDVGDDIKCLGPQNAC